MREISMLRSGGNAQPKKFSRDDLLDLVREHLVDSEAEYSSKVNNLSERKLALVCDMIARLDKMQMLNAETLSMALDRIAFKLEKVAISHAEKTREGEFNAVRLDSSVTFFSRNDPKKADQYMRGNYGAVAKAKSSVESEKTTWGVKRMHGRDAAEVKVARHEAKFNRMMGREGYVYLDEKHPHMLFSWQPGVSLKKLHEENKVADYPLEARLQWLVSLLKELNNMHQLACVHFDLFPKNVVVDTGSNKMHLIDFGLSHREKVASYFRVYEDMLNLANEIIPVMFASEIKSESVIGQALRELQAASSEEQYVLRCTSEQALHYCEKIVENFADLSENKLQTIKQETINKKDLSAEDVLRGCERPRKL